MSYLRALNTILIATMTWHLVAASSGTPPPLADGITSWRSLYPDASYKSVDAVIIGGGSAGSNAAINLLDSGLSVLLVEKNAQLGGMVNSWTDPATNTTYDYGVAAYTNYTGTIEYFERLGLNYTEPSFGTTDSYYADFTTGETVDYIAPDYASETLALESYYNVSSSYQDLFLPSYANWPAPEDIPEDLLIPFREFAIKYNLNDTILFMWSVICAGLADMLDPPTLYVMQTFGPQTAGAFLGIDVEYIPASKRNQDIYDAVAGILGESVLLNSIVIHSTRLDDNKGVELVIQDQVTGHCTVVCAKRLVLAIEPTATNMAPFNLDSKESAVFQNVRWSIVNTGIITHPSLPENGLIQNLPAAAANGNDFALPEPPFVDYIEYIGPDLWRVIVVGWENLTTAEAQEMANQAVQTLGAAGTIPATNGTNVTIQAWSNHGVMDMRTTAENLRAGYIQELYSLQGYRSTYWTGAAFSSQLSTYLWAYNLEYLTPLILDSFHSSA